MANTGYAGYKILEEYDVSTNQPTGKEKFNLIGDPDYVAPVLSDACKIVLPPETPTVRVYGVTSDDSDSIFVNYIIETDIDIPSDLVVNVLFHARAGTPTTTRTLSAATNKWETGEIELTRASTSYSYGYTLLAGTGYIVSPADNSFIITVPATSKGDGPSGV